MLRSPGIAGYYGTEGGTDYEIVLTTCKTGYYKFSGHKYSDACIECPPGKENDLIESLYHFINYTFNSTVFVEQVCQNLSI